MLEEEIAFCKERELSSIKRLFVYTILTNGKGEIYFREAIL